MATLHNGRRPALIPSIETLSPEEVQDILSNRIARPVGPPPKPCLAISPPQGQMDRHLLRRWHEPLQKQSEVVPKPDGARSCQRLDPNTKMMAPSSTSSRGNVDRPARWNQAEEENALGRHSNLGATNHCRESKRNHAAYAQDEQRRYSNEIWEDIPHMSEIEAGHGFRTAAKDIFGLKGQRSLFAEVCVTCQGTGPRVGSVC